MKNLLGLLVFLAAMAASCGSDDTAPADAAQDAAQDAGAQDVGGDHE